MADNALINATVKASGMKVQVYRHCDTTKERYVNYADCKTEYTKEQLILNT